MSDTRRLSPGSLERHYHECGYCGHYFPSAFETPADTPCPRCRSRKKNCVCEAQLYKPHIDTDDV